jgi:CBS domain-containing protein
LHYPGGEPDKEGAMRVADLMQKSVITVSPELPVGELERLLSEEEIGGVPVVADDGRICGVVSKTDVVRALAETVEGGLGELFPPEESVEDIMTPTVVTVGPDAPLSEVARLMVDGRLHRVLVADQGRLLGIVTTFDLLRVLS